MFFSSEGEFYLPNLLKLELINNKDNNNGHKD